MGEDLENSKWVYVHIGLASASFDIIKVKKDLKDYSEELNWEISVDKKGYVNEKGDRMFNIDIHPNGGKISPEELREKKDFIEGFSVSVLRDIIYFGRENDLPERLSISWFAYKNEDKIDTLNIQLAEVLTIECDLKKAIKLEKENPNLFKKAFGMSLNKWYKENLNKLDKIFTGKEDKKSSEMIIKILEDNGMEKIEIPKRNILKRIF
jgi:hypothetical protein